jgi:pSer/pThr/pTyr-binding forkhead associated (FHA) protein
VSAPKPVIAVDAETSAGETFHYEFQSDRVSIGRSQLADVRLPETAISSLHAVLERMDAAVFAVDLGSTNGTRLNGGRLVKDRRTALRPDDELTVGSFRLRVRVVAQSRELTSHGTTNLYARRMVRSALSRVQKERDASLTIVNGPQTGRRFFLTGEQSEWFLGRDEPSDIPVIDELASRHHATVVARNGEHWVVDVGAKNGVTVNRARVATERRLRDRDEIEVGRTRIVFEDPSEGLLAALETAGDVPASAPAPAPAPASAPVPATASAPVPATASATASAPASSHDSTRDLNVAAPRTPRRSYARGERLVLTLVAAGFLAALALATIILLGGFRG